MIVKLGSVSGTRRVSAPGGVDISLPLYLVLDPCTSLLRRFGKVGAENAPVRIERVAKAVVNAALSQDERFTRGGYVEISNEELLTNTDYDY